MGARPYFNPRARKERDQSGVVVYDKLIYPDETGEISIHAPVKSATRTRTRKTRTRTNFNPRARKERDKIIHQQIINSFIISIHAPVKSATAETKKILAQYQISIHAPVKSATENA